MTEARAGELTMAQVAALVGGRLEGDGAVRIAAVAPVDEAGPSQMAFLAAKRYVRFVPECGAAAFLVGSELEGFLPAQLPRVVVEAPHPALRTILAHFFPEPLPPAGVHATAVLGRGVELGTDVALGPYVVIEDGVTLGDRCRIDAHSVIGRNARIGDDCHFYPHVVVYHDTVVGVRVTLHAGVRLGSDGFGYTFVDGAHRKMPQVGRCVVEDDVEIGANSTVDRGSLGDTTVERGVKIDNLVQVAHNVKVGAHSLMAALSGIAGSTRIGKGVWLGGQAGVISHLDVGDGARLAVASKVLRDVPAGETVSGNPARPHREQLRTQALTARLPQIMERVKQLEAEVERLNGGKRVDSEA